MRKAALFFLLCAAVPVAAFAQTATDTTGKAAGQTGAQKKPEAQAQGAASAPVMRGNWTLKAPKKKRPGQAATQQSGQQSAEQNVEGPAVPPPMRQRIPQPKPKQTTVQHQSNHVNATPLVSSVIRQSQRN